MSGPVCQLEKTSCEPCNSEVNAGKRKSNQIKLEAKTVCHKDFLKDLMKISAKN